MGDILEDKDGLDTVNEEVLALPSPSDEQKVEEGQKEVVHKKVVAAQVVNIDINEEQGGITCGAIEDPRKSSKAIDERVIINFRDKNVVIARFRDKNVYRKLF